MTPSSDGEPLILQRNGKDLAADLLQDARAMQEAELSARQIDWKEYAATHRPPQAWFEGDEPKPF